MVEDGFDGSFNSNATEQCVVDVWCKSLLKFIKRDKILLQLLSSMIAMIVET